MANNNRGLWTGVGSGALAGAGAGAQIGSVVPGYGTAIGAVIGGVVGGVAGGVGGNANDEQTEEEKRAKALADFNESQFGENLNMSKEDDNKRMLGMQALNYLAKQRADSQANANMRAFRNTITG
jgi:phage tail tape-measure protein